MAKFRLIIDSRSVADSPASLTQSCTPVRLLVAAATQHVGVYMCSRETVTRIFTVRGGKYHACGDMWDWGGVGRGACWEGASPDPSSNLHYMFKLIQCSIYLYS